MMAAKTSITLCLMASLSVAMPRPDAGDGKLSKYVGREVCATCHARDGTAALCPEPRLAEHADAFQALEQSEARDIAFLCGVPEPPRESRICLGCHATAADVGTRWTSDAFRFEDGVQCEACHGPGSLHVDAYTGAAKQPAALLEPSILPGDKRDCNHCHLDRPSHRMVLEHGYRRAAVDRLYKTPVNLAVSHDGRDLYVVCRNSDSLLVVSTESDEILVEIDVGARPEDVALSPDGETAYVTNRLSGTLSVVDLEKRVAVATIEVGSEPHGVLVDATGRFAYVQNTGQDSISVIDTVARVEARRLVAGRGPWSIAVSPDGRHLYITNVRPQPTAFGDPPVSEVTVIDALRGVVTSRLLVPDANMLQGIAAVPGRDATLFTLARTKNLVPMTRLAQGWTITNGLGVIRADGSVNQVLLDAPNHAFPDPMDVAASPDGRFALVTSGGADEVALVNVAELLSTIEEASIEGRASVLPNHLGTSDRFVTKRIPVGSNPRGVVFSPDGRFAYVANALDDSVSVLEAPKFGVVKVLRLGGPEEISEIRRGERLFHTAKAAFGQQFSCRSCHPDGHVNGLTFDIEPDGLGVRPVDNRTLRGILDTSPFKWEGTNPSLERQCGPRLAVFFTRLQPFTASELRALVRYMCTIQRPPNRNRHADGLTVQQRSGKAIFERTIHNDGRPIPREKQCATCHFSPYKTSRTAQPVGSTMWFDVPLPNAEHDLTDVWSFGSLGIAFFKSEAMDHPVDVPHLNNLYDSAPYLHNGGAATLEEIWTRFNTFDLHGSTADLTRRQLNDLIAYLKAL